MVLSKFEFKTFSPMGLNHKMKIIKVDKNVLSVLASYPVSVLF